MWKSAILAACLSVIASACTTGAPTRSVPQRSLTTPVAAPATTAGVSVTLTDGQITSVQAYYSNLPAGGSPSGNGRARGRGRNGGLPPGIARNLARGKPLPPGIAKGYLPAAIVADLPRLPSGLDYVIVAGKLLLVEAATQVVRDVLLDLAFDS